MQSILRWSLENSTPLDVKSGEAPPTAQKIDTEIIDMILGKPDSVLMKEDMEVILDTKRSEDDRLVALDHLEMLVEQIDNANDLEKIKLWDPLFSVLTSHESSTEIKIGALWVIGTALQNNPAAQDVYLSYNNLPILLNFLDPSLSSTTALRSKALYTLSGLVKHNSPAVSALENSDVNGWIKLRDALQDPAQPIRKKVLFLLNTLITPTSADDSLQRPSEGPELHTEDQKPTEPVHANSHAAYLKDPSRSDTATFTVAAFEKHNIIDYLIVSLTEKSPMDEDDADFREIAFRILYIYVVTYNKDLTKKQKDALKEWSGDKLSSSSSGLSEDEVATFITRL